MICIIDSIISKAKHLFVYLNRNRFQHPLVTISYFNKNKYPVAPTRLFIIRLNAMNATTHNIGSKMLVVLISLGILRH
jgi:hypothetical protein